MHSSANILIIACLNIIFFAFLGDDTLFFHLVSGRTEKTNKDGTFRAKQDSDDPKSVNIYLVKPLEYEKVNSYTLTLQVRNSPDLVAEAQLTVIVEDENNQAPIFTNVESGNVLEHEKPGTPVMQVSAVDNDGTYPNNRVRYRISDRNPAGVKDKFEINQDTGKAYLFLYFLVIYGRVIA